MSGGYSAMVVEEVQRAVQRFDPVESACAAIRCKLLRAWLLCVERMQTATPVLPMTVKQLLDDFLGGPPTIVSIPPASALVVLAEAHLAARKALWKAGIQDWLDQYVRSALLAAASRCQRSVRLEVSTEMAAAMDKLYNDFGANVREEKGPDLLVKEALVELGYVVALIGSCSGNIHDPGVCAYRGHPSCRLLRMDISW
eukprot:TRINITY_DN76147_c0_g1_i1.p1 TRINITY_DN76147_c0_g1~~TRINITY_DN76147_c0_g1_i1.p1  ORF type:complete len:199 (+),score=38.39 TRINITY_DN76147_c0_g1_i1:55-651(+)